MAASVAVAMIGLLLAYLWYAKGEGRVPARLACRACRFEFEPDSFPTACPGCGNWAADVMQGQELDLVCVEFVREK